MRRKVTRAISLLVLCASCAAHSQSGSRVELPAVLHGTWEIGPEPCKFPGNGDSDSLLVIHARRIDNYEAWSEVLSVVQISKTPAAWKVRTREHYYEDVNEFSQIFAITNDAPDNLVIVTDRAVVYERCI